MFKILFLATLAFIASEAQQYGGQGKKGELWGSFIREQVVPDVIDSPPLSKLKVKFPCGAKAKNGNELTPTTVRMPPTIDWKSNPNSLYTLVMVDPDAPSRQNPEYRAILHWLVGNIRMDGPNTTGQEIVQYIGAVPPPDGGMHRYVLLVFQQPGYIQFDEKPIPNNSFDGRASFCLRSFVAKYKLMGPVAGNFYQAKYDNYVPEFYKYAGIGQHGRK